MKKILFILLLISSMTSAQSDSLKELLNYYPLKTGNYWEYKSIYRQGIFSPDSSAYSVEVTGDTLLMNGKTYKKLLNRYIYPHPDTSYNFERVDSSDGCVYRYKEDELLVSSEYKIDSLFARAGDTLFVSWSGMMEPGYFHTILHSVEKETIYYLGVETEVRKYSDRTSIPEVSYVIAKGFGYCESSACELGCGNGYLVYARINNIEYGKKIAVSVRPADNLIPQFELEQNYPNPFNPTTTISYEVPSECMVTLKVYDILGKEVKELINDRKQAGKYRVNFNAENLKSGMYFYTIQAGKFISTRKMVVLK